MSAEAGEVTAHEPQSVTAVANRMMDLIIKKVWSPDQVLTLKVVMEEADVGLPLARSACHLLATKGILQPRGRHGARIRPVVEWALGDPEVLEWFHRLDPRVALRLLNEVRTAVEPAATFFAAQRIPLDDCHRLNFLGTELVRLGSKEAFTANREEFGRCDIEFHQIVLKASGNPVLAAHSPGVTHALSARLPGGESETSEDSSTAVLFPSCPNPFALLMHVGVATTIVDRKADAAAAFSRGLVAEAAGGLDSIPIRLGLAWALTKVQWTPKQQEMIPPDFLAMMDQDWARTP